MKQDIRETLSDTINECRNVFSDIFIILSGMLPVWVSIEGQISQWNTCSVCMNVCKHSRCYRGVDVDVAICALCARYVMSGPWRNYPAEIGIITVDYLKQLHTRAIACRNRAYAGNMYMRVMGAITIEQLDECSTACRICLCSTNTIIRYYYRASTFNRAHMLCVSCHNRITADTQLLYSKSVHMCVAARHIMDVEHDGVRMNDMCALLLAHVRMLICNDARNAARGPIRG